MRLFFGGINTGIVGMKGDHMSRNEKSHFYPYQMLL
jgi:hypothetical protein